MRIRNGMTILNRDNLIKLLKIKQEKNILKKQIFLKEDVIKHGLLLLSKNKELTSELINKLLTFGVEEVYVDIKKMNFTYNDRLKTYRNVFFKNEKILVIDKDFKSISPIIQKLTEIGFDESNIFATTNNCLIKRYLKKYDINTIFVDKKMCMINLEILNKKIIFITNSKGEYIDIKIDKKPNLFFVSKEVSSDFIRKVFENFTEKNFKLSSKNSSQINNLRIIA